MRALTFRIFAVAMLFALPARAFDTNARAAWVYDVATGTVLMETWIRESNAPAEAPPRHNWYRLRCQGSGGGK